MSYKTSIENLQKKIIQKSITTINGNVDDFIPLSFVDLKFKKNLPASRLLVLPEYLSLLLKENGYAEIQYFSSSFGLIKAEEDGQIIFKDNTSVQKITIDEFLCGIYDNINMARKNEDLFKEKIAYIIDCSDIMLNSQNHSFAFVHLSSILGSLVATFNQDSKKYIDTNMKLIFICRNEDVVNILLTKNVEYHSPTILKPDFEERLEFIKKNFIFFNNKNPLNPKSTIELNEAASLTSKLTFKEILQIAKVSQTLPADDFKSLYNFTMFDKKTSEWENINKDKLRRIDTDLKNRVKGQDYPIEKVKDTVIRSYIGLSGLAPSKNNKKPKGILFFCGPTGVGKTELAKSLAEFIFGDEKKCIRFDMSEYNHEHSDQRLVGAPPGYVGYESGGQLTNAIKENPFSIILFDEIEKAHSKILDKFLQILEDGRLTSSKGELVDFSESFIIFTSNIGSEKVKGKSYTPLQTRQIYIDAVKDFFINQIKRPELLNRIGEKNIVPFDYITNKSIIHEIVLKKYSDLCNKLKEEKNIILEVTNKDALSKLTDQIHAKFDKDLGGRAVVTQFETLFIDELVKFIFQEIDITNTKENKIIKWKYNSEIQLEFKLG